ncbi:MAG: glycosyltransferase family 39 protein [Steroidobacteraceae bacterium]
MADLLAYFAAVGAGNAPSRSQLISFIVAAALTYLLQIRARARASGRASDPILVVHLIAVTLIAFFLRSGVFALLTNGWGWPGQAAIGFAVIATLALMGPGYAYCMSYPRWTLGSGAGWRAGALGLVACALLLRLIYSGQVELLPEEAYYWNYSRHLDFGYLDHPPMVGWLIGAGTAAFGDTELGVRIGALCCGVIASFFMYRLTRNLFGEPSGLAAVTLMQTLPFFFLAGMLMTPDAPLTATWAAAMYFLERAMIAGRGEAWWGAGLCLGIGLLSKYTIGLLGVSTFIFMLLDSPSRAWLRRWEPYGAALLALAVFSPVIIWNAHHEWASFVFQTSRRLAERPSFALHKLIASVLVLLTPTGLAAAAVLLPGQTPKAVGRDVSVDGNRAWRFIQLAIGIPLAVFAVFSLRHEVKLDWTGAPWIAAVPALALGMVHCGPDLVSGVRAWVRSAWAPTLIGLMLIYGAGLYDLALGIPGLGYGKHAELIPVGWRELGRQIHGIAEEVEKTSGEAPLIVGMDRYAIASELAFYSPDRAKSVSNTSSAHLFGQVGLMYERWFPPGKQQGRTLLLVAWDRDDLAADRVNASVGRLEPIEEGVLTRGNDVIRRYYYRLAYGYRGSPVVQATELKRAAVE